MYYAVKGNETVAKFPRMQVYPAGELVCRTSFGSQIEFVLAAGQWDSFYLDETEEE